MSSTIDAVTVRYTCDDCGDEWEEEYQDLSGVDETPDHPDCTFGECDTCGCTCQDCECDSSECNQCGCGEDEEEDE